MHNVQDFDAIGTNAIDDNVVAFSYTAITLPYVNASSPGIRERSQIKAALFQLPNEADSSIEIIFGYILLLGLAAIQAKI